MRTVVRRKTGKFISLAKYAELLSKASMNSNNSFLPIITSPDIKNINAERHIGILSFYTHKILHKCTCDSSCCLCGSFKSEIKQLLVGKENILEFIETELDVLEEITYDDFNVRKSVVFYILKQEDGEFLFGTEWEERNQKYAIPGDMFESFEDALNVELTVSFTVSLRGITRDEIEEVSKALEEGIDRIEILDDDTNGDLVDWEYSPVSIQQKIV